MRRDFQIVVPAPGRGAEGETKLHSWLKDLQKVPGFAGGTVLREYAGELLPDTLAIIIDFESVEAGRTYYQSVKGKPYPMSADDGVFGKDDDQGAVLFGGEPEHDHAHAASDHSHAKRSAVGLTFNRGGGLFARLLHGHFETVHIVEAVETAPAGKR